MIEEKLPQYDLPTKVKAFDLFCSGLSYTKVADRIGCDRTTVYRWSRDEGWMAKRDKAYREAMDLAENSHNELVKQAKLPVMRRHLKTAENLDREVNSRLEDDISTKNKRGVNRLEARDIADLAKAAKASADISARVIGLHPVTGKQSAETGMPLIQFNLQPVSPLQSPAEESHPQVFDAELLDSHDPSDPVSVPDEEPAF